MAEEDHPPCPLCGRPMPPEASNAHHLVPKTFGGRETVTLHRICHRKIHSVLSEKELRDGYASIEALKEHPEIAKFVAWVRKRPADYYSRTEGMKRR